MENLKDASDVRKIRMEWWPLFESGQGEHFLGEPGTSEAYPLPDYYGLTDVPVAALGFCLVHLKRPDEWYLVPARNGVDAWETASAYLRLGYYPPIFLIQQLTTFPRTSRQDCVEILDRFHAFISARGGDPENSRILLHIKSRLGF